MPDIFISYKKEDVARVEPIARGLAQAGYEVWWDHRIPPGRTYRDVIGAALAEAKCVLVVWSNLSAQAQWVLDEADEGKKRGVLLPVLLDEVDIPYGFRQIESARLVGWNNDLRHPEWIGLLDSVAHFVKRQPGGPAKILPPVSRPPPANAAAAPAKSGGSPLMPILGVVGAVALAGGGYFAWQANQASQDAINATEVVEAATDAPPPAGEKAAAAAPGAAEPTPAAKGYRRKPVITPGDEFATFADSGYTYCDAVLLTKVWKKDIGENKTMIGAKLINGIQENVELALAEARAAGARCRWGDLGYQPADAEKLAAAWGVNIVDAQMKAATLYTNGDGNDVVAILGR